MRRLVAVLPVVLRKKRYVPIERRYFDAGADSEPSTALSRRHAVFERMRDAVTSLTTGVRLRPRTLAIAAPRVSQRNTATNVAEPSFISQYGADLQARFGQLFTSTPEIGAATGIEVLPDGELQAAAEPIRRGGGAAAVVCPAAEHPLPASPQAVCAPVPAR